VTVAGLRVATSDYVHSLRTDSPSAAVRGEAVNAKWRGAATG
jgi:hypothetical protein